MGLFDAFSYAGKRAVVVGGATGIEKINFIGHRHMTEAGIEASTPLEQAYPLVFLCSAAAAGVTGVTMMTDAGFFGSGVSQSFPTATEAVNFLRGDYDPL